MVIRVVMRVVRGGDEGFSGDSDTILHITTRLCKLDSPPLPEHTVSHELLHVGLGCLL